MIEGLDILRCPRCGSVLEVLCKTSELTVLRCKSCGKKLISSPPLVLIDLEKALVDKGIKKLLLGLLEVKCGIKLDK